MTFDWIKITTVILTAILIVGGAISFFTYKQQSKDVLVKLQEYQQSKRTVVIFENQTTEEIVQFFSQPFKQIEKTEKYIALKFEKLEPIYKFYGIKEEELFPMLQGFKIIDISSEKGNDGVVYTFVLIEMRSDRK